MDVYSRQVVGWMVAYRESKRLAKEPIHQTCIRQSIRKEQLTLHANRGSSMKSNVVGQLLMDLGVTKTHSMPHVSNDNPYSESVFKTLKNRPDVPECFHSIEEARLFSAETSLTGIIKATGTLALLILLLKMFTQEELVRLFLKGSL